MVNVSNVLNKGKFNNSKSLPRHQTNAIAPACSHD
jgi:hypothetical protein